MRSALFWCFVITLLAFTSPATAAPPSCSEISEALLRDDDPERVAETLGTTRARVNSCTKLRDAQARLAVQRDKRERDRHDRSGGQ